MVSSLEINVYAPNLTFASEDLCITNLAKGEQCDSERHAVLALILRLQFHSSSRWHKCCTSSCPGHVIPASFLYPAGPRNCFNWKLSDVSQVSFLISSYKHSCLIIIFFNLPLTDLRWFMKLYKPLVNPSTVSLMLHSSEPSRSHLHPPMMGMWAESCAGWTADLVRTTYSQKTN